MAPSGALIGFEVIQRDEIQTLAVYLYLYSPGKAGGEIHAVNTGQQVNPARRKPHLNNPVGRRQVIQTNSERPETKLV